MNVIISNEQQNELNNLDVDIIKSLSGSYNVSELVEMFKNFFYNKMILDVTAIEDYKDVKKYEILANELDPDKIILLLPEGSDLCKPSFLGYLISYGIYNFTTNLNGIKYLLKKSNTLKDVEHIKKMSHIETSQETGAVVTNSSQSVSAMEVNNEDNKGDNKFIPKPEENLVKITKPSNDQRRMVIGFKDVTEHAGATTLIYMLKKELVMVYGHDNVVACEINSSDFQLFQDKNMISIKDNEINSVLQKFSNVSVMLIDLNDCKDTGFCNEVIYLLEPSTVMLNKLIRRNKIIFQTLMDKKVVLNKSLLLNSDVFDFEGEAGIKTFFNMPPLDERKKNAVINDFLSKLGLLQMNSNNSGSSKIFGLFRR